jgi:hypothetical protein
MAHIINSGPPMFGWQCPVCLHVLSPKVEECPHCPGAVGSAGAAFLSAFSPILPVPADEPGDGPSAEPRRHEYAFGGFPVTPREPGPMCKCSLTPCAPSREGGMCGCDEPDEAPTLTLPAEMANPAYRRMLMVDRDWREPFPGMQARLGSYSETERRALIQFRLTPADGETGD